MAELGMLKNNVGDPVVREIISHNNLIFKHHWLNCNIMQIAFSSTTYRYFFRIHYRSYGGKTGLGLWRHFSVILDMFNKLLRQRRADR
jgi:hypothetical protein